jgi:nitrogen fixation NifU-like protein
VDFCGKLVPICGVKGVTMSDILQEYSKELMDHFSHPRNIGTIEGPSGVGEVGNPRCGDVMKLFIKVKTKKENGKDVEYIDDVKVQTLGCGAAIASASMATEMIKGKKLEEAENLTNEVVAKALGGLPKQKIHCSVLARQGIQKAIEDYRNKKQ